MEVCEGNEGKNEDEILEGNWEETVWKAKWKPENYVSNQDRILGRIWSTLSNSTERPRRKLRDLAVRSSILIKG